MSVTPPSPGVSPPVGLEQGQLPPPEDGKTTNEAATGSRPHSRILSPHLQLKSLLRSPGAKKSKVDLEDSAVPKEKKELSSDLEEEGTASEYHEDELEAGREYILRNINQTLHVCNF